MIKIYTAKGCPACAAAKSKLKKLGVNYVEIDVDENPEEFEELVKKTGVAAVPIICNEKKCVVGSDKVEEVVKR
ncbi:MAG: glutaredoxin family protein [Candidatus Heimdallarchaeaceae archaeon]